MLRLFFEGVLFISSTGVCFSTKFRDRPVAIMLAALLAIGSSGSLLYQWWDDFLDFAGMTHSIGNQNAPSPDEVFWLSIKDSNAAPLFARFLENFPASSFAPSARARLEELNRAADEAKRAADEAAKRGAAAKRAQDKAAADAAARARQQELAKLKAQQEAQRIQLQMQRDAETARYEASQRAQSYRNSHGGCDPGTHPRCSTVTSTGGQVLAQLGCVCLPD